MVLEPINVNKEEIANIVRAGVVESTAGFGFGAILKGILAIAFVQALRHGHRKTVKYTTP